MNARRLVATERAAVILQLVPYLIGKGEVTVTEAADEFDVTPEQMRQMVLMLTLIGRPGDGGFLPMANDLFDIDWDLLDDQDIIVITNTVALERAPKLTAREAAALLAGLQLAASLPGVGDSALFAQVMAKLARGAAATPPEVIVAPAPVDTVREDVARALRSRVAVSFRYRPADGEASVRTVDPVKVHIADGQWYLQGWCHTRRAMRTFHLDRVSDLEVTDIPAVTSAEPAQGLFEAGDDDLVAVIRYPTALAPLLGDFLDGADIDEDDQTASATLRIADELSLRRLAARRGGALDVVSPASARRATAEWARAGLEQYRHGADAEATEG